jgi:hypothetical protein
LREDGGMDSTSLPAATWLPGGGWEQVTVDASSFLATYGLAGPDARRLTFYRLLDSLSWG